MSHRLGWACLGIVLLAAGCTRPAPLPPMEEAQWQLRERNWPAARAACDRAIDEHLLNAAAYTLRGQAWLGEGNLEAALADFNQAIRIDPDQAEPYYQRAIVYRRQGHAEAAQADAMTAHRIDPAVSAAFGPSRTPPPGVELSRVLIESKKHQSSDELSDEQRLQNVAQALQSSPVQDQPAALPSLPDGTWPLALSSEAEEDADHPATVDPEIAAPSPAAPTRPDRAGAAGRQPVHARSTVTDTSAQRNAFSRRAPLATGLLPSPQEDEPIPTAASPGRGVRASYLAPLPWAGASQSATSSSRSFAPLPARRRLTTGLVAEPDDAEAAPQWPRGNARNPLLPDPPQPRPGLGGGAKK